MDVEFSQKVEQFPAEFAGQAERRGADDDQAVGLSEGMVYGFDGDDRGFAPLAGAVQEAAIDAGAQNALLLRVGAEIQTIAGEGDGIGVNLDGSVAGRPVFRALTVKKRGVRGMAPAPNRLMPPFLPGM